jgi:hypothetical protein
MIVDLLAAKQKREAGRFVAGAKFVSQALVNTLVSINRNMTRHEVAAWVELYAQSLLGYAQQLREGEDGPMGDTPCE